MAKKKAGDAGASRAHHVVMGDAAHAGMRHLASTGQQAVAVQGDVDFAELQDEGPTARAPRPVNSNRFNR